jgi:PAS domain S-box-containing protein
MSNEYNILSEKKFENLLESAPDSIVIINDKSIIELVNIQTEKLFGYTRQEIIGKKIDILIPDRHKENHHNHVSKYFTNPKVRLMGKELELNGKKSDGLEFPVEISLSPMITTDGIWISAAIRDISERKAAEDKIIKYSLEMEQFAYIVSHDLREPLLTIKNYIKILTEEEINDSLNKNAKKYAEIIIRASNRMEALINELLEYSRLSDKMDFEKIDCNDLIDQIKKSLNLIIDSSGTKIFVNKLPVVRANSLKLKLVFQNIIDNSIKFRRKDVIPEIHISFIKVKNGWQFEISDNGIGMEEKHGAKIFNIFQRLHNKSEYEGIGIGLAHCKKIVEMHNGNIWVNSKLGLFSTFYFTILTEKL